ncbi:MAG: L-threonylcarbamoyladenylate synthase [Patescibacteria group bacterium]
MTETIILQGNYEKALEKAASIITSGGLVVVPTDTVYGIIGDATNAGTIARLYTLKARQLEKAFPIFVRDVTMARWFAYISDAKARFLDNAWPSALTVIFHHKEKLPGILTSKQDTIALRMPQSPFVLALLSRVNIPLVQTSANLSDMPPAKSAAEVIASFAAEKQKPDLVIDGGDIAGMPSTIIDLTGKQPRLVRSGVMTKEDIDMFFQNISNIN